MPTIAIIIPCYNETRRLQLQEFTNFLKAHNDIFIVFVDDGSTDDTNLFLRKITSFHPQTTLLSLKKNKGKGEAVRQGLNFAISKHTFDFIGYLDADLSTSLATFYNLYKIAESENLDIVLGSRIKKIDTNIKRSFFRHLIGRVIATIIDKKFNLGIYDTQCGAKVFKTIILNGATQSSFYTKWFFDVEILVRIHKQNKNIKAVETPLPSWHSVKNSKINVFSFFKVVKELMALWKNY
jgi:dolichyl-phosphate beta-glucosyltransferase